MNVDRVVEALEQDVAEVLELQAFPHAQFRHDVGYETLLGLGMRTEPRRQLNRRPEKVAIAFHGLSRSGADPHVHWEIVVLPNVL
jgi:hypothetical protein